MAPDPSLAAFQVGSGDPQTSHRVMDIYSYNESASLLILGRLNFGMYSRKAPDSISLRFATDLFKLNRSPKKDAALFN
jgi:hypothetical protein